MGSVEIEAVTKRFRHRPALLNWMGKERAGGTLALDKVSLSVAQGSVLALLGPNGSGKTTTLKLISTMLLPDSGVVRVHGADSRTHSAKVQKQVGFAVASERSFFPRLSARENLMFFAALDNVARSIRAERVDEMLEWTGLENDADTLVMKFSSGMYQRLGIARALMKQPSVILLDEPTRSVDPASAAHFWTLGRGLSKQGATLILATHSFNEAAVLADTIVILQHGKIAASRAMRRGEPADDLRQFYFLATGELDESAPASLRGAR